MKKEACVEYSSDDSLSGRSVSFSRKGDKKNGKTDSFL